MDPRLGGMEAACKRIVQQAGVDHPHLATMVSAQERGGTKGRRFPYVWLAQRLGLLQVAALLDRRQFDVEVVLEPNRSALPMAHDVSAPVRKALYAVVFHQPAVAARASAPQPGDNVVVESVVTRGGYSCTQVAVPCLRLPTASVTPPEAVSFLLEAIGCRKRELAVALPSPAPPEPRKEPAAWLQRATFLLAARVVIEALTCQCDETGIVFLAGLPRSRAAVRVLAIVSAIIAAGQPGAGADAQPCPASLPEFEGDSVDSAARHRFAVRHDLASVDFTSAIMALQVTAKRLDELNSALGEPLAPLAVECFASPASADVFRRVVCQARVSEHGADGWVCAGTSWDKPAYMSDLMAAACRGDALWLSRAQLMLAAVIGGPEPLRGVVEACVQRGQ